MATEGTHLGEIKKVKPSGKGLQRIGFEISNILADLHLCLSCGHVGCWERLAEQACDKTLSPGS